MVPGILILIGKAAFLLALYGFLYAVFQGLMAEARRGGRPAPSRTTVEKPVVQSWELRPEGLAPPTARPPSVAPTPLTTTPSPPVPPVAAPAPPPTLFSITPELEAPALQVPFQGQPVGETPAPAPAEAEPVGEAEVPLAQPPPPSPPEKPRPPVLHVLTSPEAKLAVGQRLELGEITRIGRGEENDIVLKDRFVSARHAEIARIGEGWVLRDLGSTNGTFRNGARIERETPLADGDRIGIGTSVFSFHEGRA